MSIAPSQKNLLPPIEVSVPIKLWGVELTVLIASVSSIIAMRQAVCSAGMDAMRCPITATAKDNMPAIRKRRLSRQNQCLERRASNEESIAMWQTKRAARRYRSMTHMTSSQSSRTAAKARRSEITLVPRENQESVATAAMETRAPIPKPK